MAKEPQDAGTGRSTGARQSRPSARKNSRRSAKRRIVPHGSCCIQATFNNTMITITDPDGRTVCWSSAGSIGFKGSRKGTPYAAQQASAAAAAVARDQYGMKSLKFASRVPAPAANPPSARLSAVGLHIVHIKDVTPIPHNGCRPPKRRRDFDGVVEAVRLAFSEEVCRKGEEVWQDIVKQFAVCAAGKGKSSS